MIPSDGGGGSAFADTSYEDFQKHVEDVLKQIHDKIKEGLEAVAKKFDDSTINNGFLNFVSPATAIAAKYFADKLEDAFEKVWDGFEDMTEKVWDQVKRLFATPGALMQISERYTKASDALNPAGVLVPRIDGYLQDGWEGDAFSNYTTASGEQAKALDSVSSVLNDASQLCAKGANQIYKTWSAIVDYLLNQVERVLGFINEATDAGKWVTLDAGPIVQFIGGMVIEVIRLAKVLADFWADNQTEGVAAWQAISGDNAGLKKGNTWPGISGYSHSNMEHKGNWDHAA